LFIRENSTGLRRQEYFGHHLRYSRHSALGHRLAVVVAGGGGVDCPVYVARLEDLGKCLKALPKVKSYLETGESCFAVVAPELVPTKMLPHQRVQAEVRWHDCAAALSVAAGIGAIDIAAIATVEVVDLSVDSVGRHQLASFQEEALQASSHRAYRASLSVLWSLA
jgi:hypothetical protein